MEDDALPPPSRMLLQQVARENRITCSATGVRYLRHRHLVLLVSSPSQSNIVHQSTEVDTGKAEELRIKSSSALRCSTQTILRSLCGAQMQASLRPRAPGLRVELVPTTNRDENSSLALRHTASGAPAGLGERKQLDLQGQTRPRLN